MRPIKYDTFEVQERVCASLPVQTATSKLFTKTCGFHGQRPTFSPTRLSDGDLKRARKTLREISAERRLAAEIATRPQGQWKTEAERESALLFIGTLYQTKPF
jgi:hypothetical protein